MNNKLLLTGCLLAAFSVGYAADYLNGAYIESLSDCGVAVGVTDDGTKVFGYADKGRGESLLSSYIFNTKTGALEWFTELPENPTDADYEKAGQIQDINDNGVIVGCIRDPQYVAPKANDQTDGITLVDNYKLFSAVVWKDGQMKRLPPLEKYADPADLCVVNSKGEVVSYPYISDGWFATKISNDGKTILGYLKFTTHYYPMRWVLNEDSGEYECQEFTRLDASPTQYIGASRDCQTMVWQRNATTFIWKDGNIRIEHAFEPVYGGDIITEPRITALSPGGEWALFECGRNNVVSYGIYNLNTEEIRWIPVPEGKTSTYWYGALAVTDSGTGFMTDDIRNSSIYYFDTNLGINIPLENYIDAYTTEIQNKKDFQAGSCVYGVSADGRTLACNKLEFGNPTIGWAIRLPEENPEIYVMKNFQVVSSAPDKITAIWEPLTLNEGATVDSYTLSVNADEYVVKDLQPGEDGKMRCQLDANGGSYVVRAVANITGVSGKQIKSVPAAQELNISTETGLYFFEDLDDSVLDESGSGYYYIHDTFRRAGLGGRSVLNFYLDVADFDNNTPFWCTGFYGLTPADVYLESRWFDATNEKDFYFTYMESTTFATLNDGRGGADNWIACEYTLDGENWIELNRSTGEELDGVWIIRTIDLKEVEGKWFRLRFHNHGGGKTNTWLAIDYYGILSDSEKLDAPEDLMVVSNTNDKMEMTWKNPLGAYEVTYNYNSPRTFSHSIGNGGDPLQIACDFDDEKLGAFTGKYMTSVSTMVYDSPDDAEQPYNTTVEAIVYEVTRAGQSETLTEVSRGKMGPEQPWYNYLDDPQLPNQVIYLDTPVKLEGGKTYRVAIRFSDYEAEMCPAWYFSASDDYIPGVTDLYSDSDDGKTWKLLSEAFTDPYQAYTWGRPIFNIRPGITDSSSVEHKVYPQLNWYYQVFRNGELVSPEIVYYVHPSFTDMAPQNSSNTYTVRSYSRAGLRSDFSEGLVVDRSGVNQLTAQPAKDFSLNFAADAIEVAGDFDKAALYTLNGVKLAETAGGRLSTRGLAPQVAVLVVEKEGKKSSLKVVIKQ